MTTISIPLDIIPLDGLSSNGETGRGVASQFHKSLRQDLTGKSQKFKCRYQHLTPAMEMGLTSTQLEWQDLILAPCAENAHKFPTSTIL